MGLRRPLPGCCPGEGCEQGDALAPALFALGQHDALQTAAEALHPDDSLVAFFDNLYVVTMPSRAKAALDATVRAVEDQCGIASNLGKTRVILASRNLVMMSGEATSPMPNEA